MISVASPCLESAAATPAGDLRDSWSSVVLVPVFWLGDGRQFRLIDAGRVFDGLVDVNVFQLGWRHLLGGGLVLLGLFRLAVEEQVDDDVPFLLALDLAAEAQHLTGEQPPHQTDRVLRLGVARDGDVDVLERGVGVAESDDRNVGVRGLDDRLVVGRRVGDDQETRLAESLLDLIGERTRSEASSDGRRLRVVGVLQDGALTVQARRDDEDLRARNIDVIKGFKAK